MASILKVDKLDPQSGTALELGTSGDTISVPSGATLDISASTLTPPATMPASSAANLTNIPGANITGTIATVSGANLTSLNATNLGSGTVPTARLGSGTASSSTVLYGDQTYKAEPGGGKILQIITNFSSSEYYTSATSFQDNTDFNATITPTSSSSQILIFCSMGRISGANGYVYFSFRRNISGGADTTGFLGNVTWGEGGAAAAAFAYRPGVVVGIDRTHSTTSAITYTAQTKGAGSGNCYFGGGDGYVMLMEMDQG